VNQTQGEWGSASPESKSSLHHWTDRRKCCIKSQRWVITMDDIHDTAF